MPEIAGFVADAKETLKHRPILIFGNSFSHLAPVLKRAFPEQLALLKVSRNVVLSAAARFVKQKPAWWMDIPPFETDEYGNVPTPSDPNFHFRRLGGSFSELTLFDRVQLVNLDRSWSHEEMFEFVPDDRRLAFQSEDMFGNQEWLHKVASLAGLEPVSFDGLKIPRNSTWDRTREENPVTEAMIRRVLEWPETQEMLRIMGDTVDDAMIAKILAKYGLPDGAGAAFRHRTHYWQTRRKIAKTFRSALGLKAENRLGETD